MGWKSLLQSMGDCMILNMFVCLMVLNVNATFNNISVISWRSVLSVEETGEDHRPVASH